jgi:hypothetical protein
MEISDHRELKFCERPKTVELLVVDSEIPKLLRIGMVKHFLSVTRLCIFALTHATS